MSGSSGDLSTGISRRRAPRARFWLEVALTAASGLLLVVTFAWRNWIEALGFDPDNHNGSFEWASVAMLLVVTLGFAAITRAEWHRNSPVEGALS
jgi:DMSO/TMAO reductase YedYZ heme-binding membrane subunit